MAGTTNTGMRDWIDMVRQRILVHLSRTEHRVIDREDVYFVQADGDESHVRLRGRNPLVDIRPLGDLEPTLAASGRSLFDCRICFSTKL